MDAQPQKSNALKFLLIAGALVALLFACAFGSCMLLGGVSAVGTLGTLRVVTGPPAEQTEAFFADLRARNYAGALARTTPEYQAAHPLPAFQQSVEAIAALTQQTADTVTHRSVNSSTAQMSGTLSTPQGNVAFDVSLVERATRWQIASVVVAGTTLQ